MTMTTMSTMAAAASSNVDGGRWDPTVVVVTVYDNNDKDSDCIIKTEQRGRTANLPNGGAVMTASVFLVLVLVGVILSDVSIIVGIVDIVTSLHRCIVIIVVAGPHSLCCRHHSCLRHSGSCCCCRQLLRCSPPSTINGWLLCHLLRCLPPNLSSAAFVVVQSSTLLPPAAVPYCQPLPAAVLSIKFAAPVDGGCCVLCPPSSIPTEPPS